MERILLTVTEAAQRLAVGRSQLYELLRRGEIVSVRIGRSRRVPVRALEDFAKAKIAEALAENAGDAAWPTAPAERLEGPR